MPRFASQISGSLTTLLYKGKFFFVFLVLLLLPLLFSNLVLESGNLPPFLFFSSILILGFILLLKRDRFWFPPTTLFILLVLFYVFNLVSTCWAQNKITALYESQKIFLGLCTVGFFLNVLTSERDERDTIRSLILIAVLCCIQPILLFIQLPDLQRVTLSASMGASLYERLLPSLLLLLMAFVFYGILFFRNLWFYLSFFSGLLICATLLIFQVRGVYLGFCVACIVFFLFGFLNFSKLQKQRMAIFLLTNTVLLTALYLILDLAILGDTKSYWQGAAGITRYDTWSATIAMIRDNFFLGVGAGNWRFNILDFLDEAGGFALLNVRRHDPHNDLLWVMAETGIFCFLVLLFKMLTILKFSFTEIFRNKNLKVLLFFSFLCALITAAMFSGPKDKISHIVIACLLLALLLNHLPKENLMSRTSKKPVIAGMVLLAGGMLLGLVMMWGEYKIKQIIKPNKQAIAILRSLQK